MESNIKHRTDVDDISFEIYSDNIFGLLGPNGAGKRISKLSQGMKQKASLAISVLHDPKFIIFYEPTNGLDVLTAKDVRNFILDMKNKIK